MSNSDALQNFLQSEAAKCSQTYILQMTNYLKKEHRDVEVDKLAKMLRLILAECIEKETIKQVRFIQISTMRSMALKFQAFFVLECYGENFFGDEPLARHILDFPWIYDGYKIFCESLEQESRKYIGRITSKMLDQTKLIELIQCQKVMRLLLGDALAELIISDEFKRLSIEKGVQIQLGDYHGKYELIMRTDEHTSNIGELLHGIL